MESDFKGFHCGKCKKHYATDYLLRLHQRRIHTDRRFICHYCNCETKLKDVLRRHIIRVHLSEKKKAATLYACPFCSTSKERKLMVEHYTSVHGIDVTESALEFKSKSEFFLWKHEVEQRDSCQFILPRGERKRSSGVWQYFRCSRDGLQRKDGVGERKRRPKVKGSVKTNFVCPSSVQAHFANSGHVRVKFVGTHVGHTCDVGRLRLTEAERIDIAQKLAANVPIGTILDSIRDSVGNGSYSRIHLTTRKDLLNMKRRLCYGRSVHPVDSVDAWTKTDATPNLVRSCKPKSEPSISTNEIPREPFEDIQISQEKESSLERSKLQDPLAENLPIEPAEEDLETGKKNLLFKMTNLIETIQTFDEYRIVQKALRHVRHTLEAERGGLILHDDLM